MPKTMSILTALAMMLAIAGCDSALRPQRSAEVRASAPEDADASYLVDTTVRGDENTGGPSAVQSALAWSDKYAQAAEKLVRLQQANQALEGKNRQLLAQIAKSQIDTETSRKELNEANAMLIELRGELTKWKSNVLGFRQEIQTAQQAQLEALQKVLRLLGGEVPEPTTRPAAAKPDMTTQAPASGAAKETASASTK